MAVEMNSIEVGFQEYLVKDKGLSVNSVSAYLRDAEEFAAVLREKGVHSLDGASRADVAAWLLGLKQRELSAATVNRKLASLRAYFRYAVETGRAESDPTTGIRSPRITRKGIEYLSIGEVERLLTAPSDTDIGRRDLAVLEMLYATGLRVTELMYVNLDDINLRMGFVTCNGAHGKARIIPIGRPARAALEQYIYDIRPHLQRGKTEAEARKESALFLNYYGERITRQALWKILKSYSEKAGIDKKITPQILRNSFAVHMVQNGADLNTLQELMGHEDPVATQAYLSVSKNRIKDVYDSAHPRA
jgi:integrase/recombinase XerD